MMPLPGGGRGGSDARGRRWATRIEDLEAGLLRLERWICAAAMAVIMLAVFATVVVRNLDLPLPNFAEHALVAMVALTFVGGAMCTHLGAHIAIDAVRAAASGPLRRLSEASVAVGVLAFAAIYLYSGLVVLGEAWTTGERMLDLGTPLIVPTAFVPLGMALMLVHSACQLLRALVPSRFEASGASR